MIELKKPELKRKEAYELYKSLLAKHPAPLAKDIFLIESGYRSIQSLYNVVNWYEKAFNIKGKESLIPNKVIKKR